MRRQVIWVVIKSCYVKHKLIHREIYGNSNKLRDCAQMIRDYKKVVLDKQEPFLQGTKYVRGIGNRSGVDIGGDNGRLVELRIHPINIFVL